MRLLAPLLVATTVVLFASGVAMGILHGHALTVARRLHGPASVVWIVLVGVHVLVYLKRALISSSEDLAPSSRASVRGASARAYLLASAIVFGVVIGVATVPRSITGLTCRATTVITILSTTLEVFFSVQSPRAIVRHLRADEHALRTATGAKFVAVARDRQLVIRTLARDAKELRRW